MGQRAEVHVDLGAIASNIKKIRGNTEAEVLAVVKANAYGHGLIPVANCALESGATWLGVALLEEAFALREAGISEPLIAWLTPLGEDFSRAIELNIDLSLASIDHARAIESAGKSLGKKPRVHIEFDSGMGRGGFTEEDFTEFLEVANTFELDYIGFWTHFARADEPERPETDSQITHFDAALAQLKSAGINPQLVHLANSAAAQTRIGAHRNIVRLGISMYGLSPDVTSMGSGESLGLIPAMSVVATLALVKKVKAGTPVGYGGVGVTSVDTTLGIVAMGYSDGIPRNTSSAVGVTFHGVKAPIIGRVSMDQFVVDLGPGSEAKNGDQVLLFGAGGYSIDEWAEASKTINYEIVTRLASRVPRIYG